MKRVIVYGVNKEGEIQKGGIFTDFEGAKKLVEELVDDVSIKRVVVVIDMK